MDNQAVINYIQESRDETTEKNKLGKMVQSLEKLSENEEWKLKIPSININAAIKFDLLGIIPKSIMQILLSPKNLLGFMTMFKAIQNNIVDLIEDLEDFFLTFKSFLIEMMSKIGSIFVEELFKNIKANLSQLVRLIITDISKESRDATTKMIFTVLETVIILADGFLDWRQCKSVVDELFKLLQIAGRNLDLGLPSFALSLSRFLPGMSETRVYANYIEELQKNGIPTGDLPDGSPNIALQSNLSMIKGQFKEMHENGKTEVTLDPISIIGGTTTGSVKMYGKSY